MKLKGYASTQSPVPIKVQNLVIQDYCAKHGHEYFLSDVEFVSGCHVLQGIPLAEFDGICAYSMSLFPVDFALRGKEVHFALEGYVLPRDREICETIWRIKALMEERRDDIQNNIVHGLSILEAAIVNKGSPK